MQLAQGPPTRLGSPLEPFSVLIVIPKGVLNMHWQLKGPRRILGVSIASQARGYHRLHPHHWPPHEETVP